MAAFDDFMKLDIRVGTIVSAKPFEKARKPAYQLEVDFGEEHLAVLAAWNSDQGGNAFPL